MKYQEAVKLAEQTIATLEDRNDLDLAHSVHDLLQFIVAQDEEVDLLSETVMDLIDKQRWISVEDRLPEEGERVLTWIGEPAACHPGTEAQIGCFYSSEEDLPDGGTWTDWGFTYYRSGFLGGREVTHWMPIPPLGQEDT
jgi:hypothetical protein